MAERITITAKNLPTKEEPFSHKRKTGFRSQSSHLDRILFLQRTVGNQAVQRLLRSGALQAKLRIGQPGDIYEQEADQVADAVMRMPEPGVQREVEPEEKEEETLQSKPLVNQITPLIQVQRQEEPEEEETLQVKSLAKEITPLVQRQVEPEEEEEELQAKATSGRFSEVNSNLESHIQSFKGGGQPLSENDRTFFEPRFGRDFSHVRVHTNTQAAKSARAVNAKAFTIGQDVVFGAGQYAPGAIEGRRLMAHELTHVKQQGQSNRTHGIGDVVHRQSTDIAAASTTDTAIENLDLATKAKAAAYALKAKHPTITFTSGRRSKNDQARAMASNVVSNRNWIKETYSNTTARRKCQEWVDNHPTATTKSAIQTGLKTVLDSLTEAQLGALSKHLSGEAFDVQPVTVNAAAIKADIRALSGIKKFLEREGGLTRWHAQF